MATSPTLSGVIPFTASGLLQTPNVTFPSACPCTLLIDLEGNAQASPGSAKFSDLVSFILPEGWTYSLDYADLAAATVTATAGTPQSAATGSLFTTNLRATVVDAAGMPVPHADVTFTAPASGPSGTFPGGTVTSDAVTDDFGAAISPGFTANTTAGAYKVTASAGTATPASFALTNTGSSPAPSVITAKTGTPQSATSGTAFAVNLQALVLDSAGHAVPNVTVTFTAPASGPSGTFPGSSLTATATTDNTGIATAPVFTANATAGGPYNVTASVAGVATPAIFLQPRDGQDHHHVSWRPKP